MAASKPVLESGAVRAELWSSFAGLLRSYVAAHGLNHLGGFDAVVEVGRYEISLRRGARRLALHVNRDSGVGDWHWDGSRMGSGSGSFELLEDGRVRWADEGAAEMDMVAERLAAELYRLT